MLLVMWGKEDNLRKVYISTSHVNFMSGSATQPYQELEQRFAILEPLERDSLASQFFSAGSKSRKELHERVFAYYDALQDRFPETITWDDQEFKYMDFSECSFVLEYNLHNHELSFVPEMIPRQYRKEVLASLASVSPKHPADIIMPLPVGVIVPLLDVCRMCYVGFASNEGL